MTSQPRRPGNSRLVYNKATRTIDTVSTLPATSQGAPEAGAWKTQLPPHVRDFLGKVQGVCMGVAMSGSNHPNPDGALMELFREAQDILFPADPLAASPSPPPGVEVVKLEWEAAYKAFVGAFDTPLARRQFNDEYAQDARRRLAAFNDAMLAARLGAAP